MFFQETEIPSHFYVTATRKNHGIDTRWHCKLIKKPRKVTKNVSENLGTQK